MELTDVKSNKIQMLRGLAIIAVVFIHNTPKGLAQVYCRPFLNFSVGLFLFLSGMLSNANNWNPRKRIKKVAIPYILWTFVYVILYNLRTPTMIPILYLKNLVTGNAAAVMYYIFVYIEFTLLMPLIGKLAKSRYKYLGFAVAPIEIIFMRMMPMITGCETNRYISLVMHISCLGWFTYYYLGYLIGNKIIVINSSTKNIAFLWIIATVLQIAEGYWYLSMGETDCGSQLKLSSILSGALSSILAYNFINSSKKFNINCLRLLGDYSFGIYFSHLAVMVVLRNIPIYAQYVCYPVNAVITVLISMLCVLIGKKILGKYSKYFAL